VIKAIKCQPNNVPHKLINPLGLRELIHFTHLQKTNKKVIIIIIIIVSQHVDAEKCD
jgi:hypothetical protein